MGTIFPLNRRRNKDELIQAKINRKEQNIDKWRDVYKKAWILLVLDGSVESSKLREPLKNPLKSIQIQD